MKSVDGSALLIIVLFMSILSLFCFSFWQSSALLHDLSLKYLEYEQKYRVAEGGINYAINVCKKNFDTILQACKENGQSYQVETQPWKIADNITYRCKNFIAAQDHLLCITSTLFDSSQKKVFSLSCYLKKNSNSEVKNKSTFFIKNWSVGES